MSTKSPPTQNGIDTDDRTETGTLHTLALELADPPIEDFRAFCVIVAECRTATVRAVEAAR